MVEQQKTYFYRFSLDKEDSISIPVELDVAQNYHEIEYFIVSEPDSTKEDFYNAAGFNWNNIYASKQIWEGRFQIAGRPNIVVENSIELETFDMEQSIGFDLVEGEDLHIFCESKAGSTATLVVGQKNMDLDYYVVVAFSNWKQVPLNEGIIVGYFDYNDGNNSKYSITFPESDSGAIYQMFVFGFPNRFEIFDGASCRIELKN